MLDEQQVMPKLKVKKRKVRRKAPTDPLQRELESIKRLLCVLLLKGGASQNEIAFALGIDRADFSRMMPARQFKPFAAKKA